MNTQALLDPKSWAERTFGSAQLHDRRRTRRAVQAATNLAENPLGSLPAHMQTWKETKALYRLLDEPDVTFAALMQPHLQQTREQALSSSVVLLVQDTTDIDLSHRRKNSGINGASGKSAKAMSGYARCMPLGHLSREACGCMSEIGVRICSRSSRRVARRRRTFWCERESHGASSRTKTRSAIR